MEDWLYMNGRLTDEESNALETIYSNTKVGFTTEVIPQDIAVGGGKIVTLLKYTATAPTTRSTGTGDSAHNSSCPCPRSGSCGRL